MLNEITTVKKKLQILRLKPKLVGKARSLGAYHWSGVPRGAPLW
jgi:hypothetical protein